MNKWLVSHTSFNFSYNSMIMIKRTMGNSPSLQAIVENELSHCSHFSSFSKIVNTLRFWARISHYPSSWDTIVFHIFWKESQRQRIKPLHCHFQSKQMFKGWHLNHIIPLNVPLCSTKQKHFSSLYFLSHPQLLLIQLSCTHISLQTTMHLPFSPRCVWFNPRLQIKYLEVFCLPQYRFLQYM